MLSPLKMMLEGVLIVDKPFGITSHDVVNRVRRLGDLRRVGHAGTLDPLATGVLVLCLGRVTRLVEYLVGQRKEYAATIRLGQTTNTFDAEGLVVAERPFSDITLPAIKHALDGFRGPIQQRPPLYAAIKQGGRPLYKLARQGIEVERPLRDVHIYDLQLTGWDPPLLQLTLFCSSGTYVRSLAHDLGEALGCGGHLTALQRTAVGDFTLADATPLDELTPQNLPNHLRPPETAVAHLPAILFTENDALALQMGQPVAAQAEHDPNSLVRIYRQTGEFVGVAAWQDHWWQAVKIIQGIH